MPVDPINSAGSVDDEVVYTHIGDAIERLRLVGQSLEHGKDGEAISYFQAALEQLSKVATAFHRPALTRVANAIAVASRQIKEDAQFRILKRDR